MKMKHTILTIIAHDILNGVEIYRGHAMNEANKAVDSYCDFMGLPDDEPIHIEVIYI